MGFFNFFKKKKQQHDTKSSLEYIEYDESMDTPFYLKIKKHHKKADENNSPEYIKRLLSISDSAFYDDDFWGMHLFDNDPFEIEFKKELKNIMPTLEKVKKYYQKKYDYYSEHYLDSKLRSFKNFEEYISHSFENDLKIKDKVEFIISWRDSITNLHK